MDSANEAYARVDNETKRLLTIDQVNEEFPVMMYKAWKAKRERDGLLSDAAIITDNPDTTLRKGAVERSDAPTTVTQKPVTTGDASGISTDNAQAVNTVTSSVLSITGDRETKTDGLPTNPSTQFVGVVEDTCSICLEVPEEDDDVRSLKCGHCFHQACIDPWLTSQRGACPLCKRDCYLPPEPQSPAERDAPLLQTANEYRFRHETGESNIRAQNTHGNVLAPPPSALSRASWVHRMNDRERRHTSLPLPLYAFRREHNLGEPEDSPSRLERGET